jgi:hypothetical protein
MADVAERLGVNSTGHMTADEVHKLGIAATNVIGTSYSIAPRSIPPKIVRAWIELCISTVDINKKVRRETWAHYDNTLLFCWRPHIVHAPGL